MVKLFSFRRIPTCVITIHQRYRQTDGRTDRQTTCDRNNALCTKMHRSVKTQTTRTLWPSHPSNWESVQCQT